jgi:hypothetical protein
MLKRPGRGADHPPPSSAEVENEESYTSTLPLGLRVCYRANFTLLLFNSKRTNYNARFSMCQYVGLRSLTFIFCLLFLPF